MDAIITAVVVEHSLRIRVKAEGQPDPAPVASAAPIPPLPVEASSITLAGSETDVVAADIVTAHSQATTVVENDTTFAKGDTASLPTSTPAESEKPKSGGKNNLIGRVNNLVTSDLANISNGARDILRIGMWLNPLG